MGNTFATFSWLNVTLPFRESSSITSSILTVSIDTIFFRLSVKSIGVVVSFSRLFFGEQAVRIRYKEQNINKYRFICVKD